MNYKEYLEQVTIVKQVFSFYKTTKLNKRAFIMLLFQTVLFDNKDKKSFLKLIELATLEKVDCYKVVLTDNTKIMIDNKLDNNYYFMSFKDLINNYFVLNNTFFKGFNFNQKCILYVDKRQDKTYYKIFVFSKKGLKDLQKVLNYTNYKYKFNMNKKERSLVYKLKNNYLYGFKYSYNFNYMLDIQDNIETIKQELKTLEQDKKDLSLTLDSLKQEKQDTISLGALSNDIDIKIKLINVVNNINKDYEQKQETYIKTVNKIKELETHLKELKTLESELTSSTFKETTLNDYFTSFKYKE